jgi:general secretion pathway protein D
VTAAGPPAALRPGRRPADLAAEQELRRDTFRAPLTLAQAPDDAAAARARAAAARARAAGAAAAATPPAAAASPGAGGGASFDPNEPVTVDFKDAEIIEILRFLAEKTGTNYFMDPTVNAKVTVIGPNPIPLGRAIEFLEAAMESRGLTVVDSGIFKEVIPKAKAATRDVPLYTDGPPRPLGSKLEQQRTVTEILELRYAPVEEVKAAIGGLLENQGGLISHAQSNKIIVTETVRNLERLKRVIGELDVPIQGKGVHLVPVKFRKAEDLAKSISEILEKEEREKLIPPTKEVGATKPALLADAARNLLVVVATRRDFARVKRLIEQLDADPEAGPVVEFLELGHAEPADVVEKIKAAFAQSGDAAASFTVVADDRTRSILLRTQSPNLGTRIRQVIAQLDRPEEGMAGSRVRVYHMDFAEAEQVSEILGQIDFMAPSGPAPATPAAGAAPTSEALVITAPRDLFPAIEAVIEELDVVKPQVLVEVLIAEVDFDWAKGVGLDFNFLNETSSSNNRPFVLGNNDNLEGLFAGGGIANGLNIGMLTDRTFDAAAAAGGDLGELSKISLLGRLFQNSSHANILSAPSLYTSDNETARIQVGERIQVPASFGTAANTGLNTVTSFNTEDIGVILEITPRITRNDHVVLKIDQTISARTGDLLGALETPVISNREVSTRINVMNQETVVIGGLISEEEIRSRSRMPGLSKLPLIGSLFRNHTTTKRKTNLLVFLTPHIVRSEAEARYLTGKAARGLRERINASKASRDSVIRSSFREGGRSLGQFGDPDPEPSPSGSTGKADLSLSPRLKRLVDDMRSRYQGGRLGTGDGAVIAVPAPSDPGSGAGSPVPPGARGTGG